MFVLPLKPLLGQPSIVHGYKYQDFEILIRDTVKFLNQNPTEVVVMRLKAGNVGRFLGFIKIDWQVKWPKVDKVLRKYRSHIYTGKKNPLERTVKELGGKIIICHTDQSSTYYSTICEGSYKPYSQQYGL